MRVYGLLSKLLPESTVKTRVRDFCFGQILYRATVGTTEYTLKDDVRGRFRRLVLLPNGRYTTEIIGYERHYAIKEGDVVVDAGAFLGHFTVYAAVRVGGAGKVVCFEPDPYVFRLLLRNIKLNGLRNVIAVNKGLWSNEGECLFESRGNASSLDVDGRKRNFLTRTVKVTSVDKELERLKLSRVDLIKMDIEGAEIEAVAGCREVMGRCNVNFAVASYHIVQGEETWHCLERLFRAMGYASVTEYPLHRTTYAWKAG